jgi:hypothetical protein
MFFYTMDGSVIDVKLPHKLEGFYLSIACIENGKLVKHQCNHQDWSTHYVEFYKDKPISDRLLFYPMNDEKFRMMEWCGGINLIDGNVAADFFEERTRILKASHGYIAYKVCKKERSLVVMMYAIAAYDENPHAQELLLKRVFMEQAFSKIIKAIT